MPRTTEMRMRMRRMLPCHDLRLTNSTTHTQSTHVGPAQQPLPRGENKTEPKPKLKPDPAWPSVICTEGSQHFLPGSRPRLRLWLALARVEARWLQLPLTLPLSLFAFAKLHTFIEAAVATKNASNCALLATRPQMPSSWQAGCLRLPS